jgi:predicted regulator of Ras-like GTPase activity (Roadblock/LC7/MglB family)
VEDIERKLVKPNEVATFYIHRVDWLLAAAVKFEEDEAKRGAYVAEAKGLMERATRSLRTLQPEDWREVVSDLSFG